jgi:hypothetical protein
LSHFLFGFKEGKGIALFPSPPPPVWGGAAPKGIKLKSFFQDISKK